MQLVLTGATGLVGSAVLHHMLSLPASQVSKIHILSRRPVPLSGGDPRVNLIIHKDFSTYPKEVIHQLKEADGVVWALGISQNDVSKEDYIKITHDYPLNFLKALLPNIQQPVKFIYVSGEGATTSPSFLTARYGKVKGETEQALLNLSHTDPKLKVYSARPAVVDPSEHAEIQPFIPTRPITFKVAESVISPVLRTVWPGMMSPTRELGRALVELAMGDGEPLEGRGTSGEGRTLGNVALRRLA